VVYLKPKQLIIKDCAGRFVLKLYRHEASRGLFATAEVLVTDLGRSLNSRIHSSVWLWLYICGLTEQTSLRYRLDGGRRGYHYVQLNALFCCLWCNVEAFCHKHFVVFSRHQRRRLLPAMCHNCETVTVVHRRLCLQHPACCSVNTRSQARYRLGNAISAYSTCIRRPR